MRGVYHPHNLNSDEAGKNGQGDGLSTGVMARKLGRLCGEEMLPGRESL